MKLKSRPISEMYDTVWKGLTNEQIIQHSNLAQAYQIAIEESTDKSTQNGAVIVGPPMEEPDDKPWEYKGGVAVRAWVHAANRFAKGVKETPERWTRPTKYLYVEHAERNAIYTAARQGMKTEGGTMYCAWASCADCARGIIEAGIKELVTHHNPWADTRFGQPVTDQWKESIKVALGMLEEAGVKITWLDCKIFHPDDDIKILYNGTLVSP